jgi:hypothetical protein
MTEAMFKAVVQRAEGRKTDDGVVSLPEGRTLTLYAAHDGTSLQVARVTTLSLVDGIVEARDVKGELFLLSLEDVFAASVAGDANHKKAGRKAGFLG